MISRLLLALNTIRYLRPRQVIYRPIRSLQKAFRPSASRPVQVAASRIPNLRQAVTDGGPGDLARRIARADEVCDNRFTFLNVSMQFESIPWTGRPVSQLWAFNLQYFDYALDLAWAFQATKNSQYLRKFEELFTEWERATRAGGGDAWEPYVISVRAVNFVYAFLLLEANLRPTVREPLLASIDRQTRHLERRLEWHLLGNHLLKNLHAIAVVGLIFEGPVGEGWRSAVTSRLWTELDEQVLKDGGHFERSPMYHAIALGDLLELIVLRKSCGAPVPARVLAIAEKMLDALELMSHSNGDLRLFNDAANGVAPERSRLANLARRSGIERRSQRRDRWTLADTGYYGASRGKFDLMIDCGRPGARYQPGHSHCDLLSYELDYDGNSLVVDSGVSDYVPGPSREYSRSTRAHNTLMVAGREQSEMWGAFRVGRRARVVSAELSANENPADALFRGAYQPYGGHLTHRRTFFLSPSQLRVVDRIDGDSTLPVLSFVHFHPQCRVEQTDAGFIIRLENIEFFLQPFGVSHAVLVKGREQPMQGWYLPQFGVRVPSPVVVMSLDRHLNSDFGYNIAVSP
ncbi:MAG TPA: alginate lyase family protein [Gemmatimonadaceae bacterium]